MFQGNSRNIFLKRRLEFPQAGCILCSPAIYLLHKKSVGHFVQYSVHQFSVARFIHRQADSAAERAQGWLKGLLLEEFYRHHELWCLQQTTLPALHLATIALAKTAINKFSLSRCCSILDQGSSAVLKDWLLSNDVAADCILPWCTGWQGLSLGFVQKCQPVCIESRAGLQPGRLQQSSKDLRVHLGQQFLCLCQWRHVLQKESQMLASRDRA